MGRSHEKEQVPCQDRTLTYSDGTIYFISLADGAGSAKLSDTGAEVALNTLCQIMQSEYKQLCESDEEELASYLLNHILHALQLKADELQTSLHEFASTLLFAVTDGTTYMTGHLGDGIIACKRNSLEVYSYPENGEYANATFFTTSKDARQKLRITRGDIKEIEAFFLMSDGTSASMLRNTDHTVAPALSTIATWLKEYDEATVTQALQQNLEKSIRLKTFDDCSLAVMVKQYNSSQQEEASP